MFLFLCSKTEKMEQHIGQTYLIIKKAFAQVLDYEAAFLDKSQLHNHAKQFITNLLDMFVLDTLNTVSPDVQPNANMFLMQWMQHRSSVEIFANSLMKTIQESTGLNVCSIVKILRCLEQDSQVPDNLREYVNECLNIFYDCFIGTPNEYDIAFDTPLYAVSLSTKIHHTTSERIATMYLHNKDVDKVRRILRQKKLKDFHLTFKPREFQLNGHGDYDTQLDNLLRSMNLNPNNHTDRVLNYLEFPLSVWNAEDFAYIIQCISTNTYEVNWPLKIDIKNMSMRYVSKIEGASFVRNSIIEDFMERFRNSHFRNMISLYDNLQPKSLVNS